MTQKTPDKMVDPIPAEEVGYARVSTPSQSPDMQIALLEKRGIYYRLYQLQYEREAWKRGTQDSGLKTED